MRRMNDDDWRELGIGLGPLGRGIYYAWNAVADSDGNPEWGTGVSMTGWTLACNDNDDLVFLKTEGYTFAYFCDNSAPGGAYFALHDFAVKSRESDAKFMVMHPFSGGGCDRDQMVEWARRWSGYEVTGDEKEYYMRLIRAAKAGEGQEQ
ncbi:uncharacterized protein BO66DRAFT_402644 [Aspergillus aculeatinus CBS 121060]|uniref:Uncharacterized protein n=1 Tax=Aspergillus aculeatinus CBS 121060 TaxID=1448322 RepID=A0ACD1H4R3_9EURO|nr:hypothetical protein BO66DRAFT_402644 [Aspergillus aculeatinus CBS 121060]RAH68763.1 hypothetical protein BO66DRAFT_402644 [Aspergillus aculeatinus CBS 121060]